MTQVTKRFEIRRPDGTRAGKCTMRGPEESFTAEVVAELVRTLKEGPVGESDLRVVEVEKFARKRAGDFA